MPSLPNKNKLPIRVVNIRTLRNISPRPFIYVGRSTPELEGHPLANPFKLPKNYTESDLTDCLENYIAWLDSLPDRHLVLERLLKMVRSTGLPLGCWCCDWDGVSRPPPKCHAVILAEIMMNMDKSKHRSVGLSPVWSLKEAVKLYHGDAKQILSELPSNSVHCIVTSPPYWKQRKNSTDNPQEVGIEPNASCGTWACNNCYMCDLFSIFLELRRVVRDDGTVWVVIGDKVSNGRLLGLPHIFTSMMSECGWFLVQEQIWHKPSPMPSGNASRVTCAHEYIFTFAQSDNFYMDIDAIREPTADGAGLKNRRSVWTIASSEYTGSHFSPFPSKLAELCLLAGTSQEGCCNQCGAPFRRVTERTKLKRYRPNDLTKRNGQEGTGNYCPNTVQGSQVTTLGWEPTCNHTNIEVEPCVVLDPFMGSGTTACVSYAHGRKCIGIDLNKSYLLQNASTRIIDEVNNRTFAKKKLITS